MKVTKAHAWTSTPPLRTAQAGVTMIELMVAMVISLILIAGVIQIFLGSQQAYRFQESLSRVQENGRFASELLTRDTRMADYRGCAGQAFDDGDLTDLVTGGGSETFTFADAVMGYTYDNGWSPALDPEADGENPSTHSDIVRLRSLAYGPNARVLGDDGQSSGTNLFVSQAEGFEKNQRVIATNCTEGVRFQIQNMQTDTNPPQMTVGGGNPQFYETYLPDRVHGEPQDRFFFVADNDRGTPALFRFQGGQRQELVEGVERMVIEYGEHTTDCPAMDGNNYVDAYRSADQVDRWDCVVAVRFSLLVRAEQDNVTDEPQTVSFPPGEEFTADDRRLRQVFTTTIGVRNRLP